MMQRPTRRVPEDPLSWTIFRGFAWGVAFAIGFGVYAVSWLPYMVY